MKKQFLILTILASVLPFTTKAEAPKIEFTGWQGVPEMSKETINASIDKYGSIYCKEGLGALKQAVQKCYKDTPETSKELDKCMIADRAMAAIAVRKNMRYESIYGPYRQDPNARDPYYSLEIANPREKYYLSSARFKNDPIFDKVRDKTYFYLPTVSSLVDAFTERCPGTY